MAVELGLVGVSVYLAIIVMFFRRVYSLFAGLPGNGLVDSNLALIIGISLSVFILNNFFIDSSLLLYPNVVFFTFGGLADGFTANWNSCKRQMRERFRWGFPHRTAHDNSAESGEVSCFDFCAVLEPGAAKKLSFEHRQGYDHICNPLMICLHWGT